MPNNVNKLKLIPPAAGDWKQHAPSPFEETVLTIVCGNSNYHWALHMGMEHKFVPSLFWNTPHSDNDEENYHKEDPCDLLMTHIAPQAHTLMFGNKDNMGCIQQASEAAAKRKHPILSIYVVSSNPEAERKLIYMFRHVPVRMYKLKNTDFFTPEEGLYETMGVDRTAVLYGAKLTFETPVLTIDGGTAMTYAALDHKGHILGGGISPGIDVRLRSLHDNTGALPSISHQQLKDATVKAMTTKTPLPTFAKETQVAMMTSACSEVACQLRNIVKQFAELVAAGTETAEAYGGESNNHREDTTEESATRDTYVVITGGDGDLFRMLLKHDASKIVQMESDVQPIPDHIKVIYSKNFAHYGIAELLHQKCAERPVDPSEELRSKMMGLRVAVRSKTEKSGISRATVLCVDSDPPPTQSSSMTTTTTTTEDPSSELSSYSFLIRNDNNAKQQMLSLKAFYDGLVLYDVVGESDDKEVDEDWLNKKKTASKDVQEIMLNKCLGLRNRKLELLPLIAKGELPQFLGCRTEEERDAKRRKMASRVVIENPQQYIGKRVAKEFPSEDPEDSSRMIDSIFFGTVQYLSDEAKLWYFVRYDDGDSEEYELNDIQYGLKLYDANRKDDMKAKPEAVEDDTVMNLDNDRDEEEDDDEGEEQKIEIDEDTGEPTKEPTTIPRQKVTMIDL